MVIILLCRSSCFYIIRLKVHLEYSSKSLLETIKYHGHFLIPVFTAHKTVHGKENRKIWKINGFYRECGPLKL